MEGIDGNPAPTGKRLFTEPRWLNPDEGE